MVRPGDQVRLTSVITARHADAATVDCKAEVDGEAVCNAKILFTYWEPTDGGQLKDLEIRQRNLLTLCQFCQVGDPPRPGDRHLAGSPA